MSQGRPRDRQRIRFPGDFTLEVSGASRLDLSEMSVGALKFDLSGASRIDGQITARGETDFRITGASRIDLKGSGADVVVEAAARAISTWTISPSAMPGFAPPARATVRLT